MARTKSAKKAIRSQAKKFVFNLRHRKAFRAARKEVLKLAEAGDKKALPAAVTEFYKQVDKAAQTKAIHKNTAARYKSRVASKLTAASAK